MWCETN
jgi:hypothetical protein